MNIETEVMEMFREEGREEGFEQGEIQTTLAHIHGIMNKLGLDADRAMPSSE